MSKYQISLNQLVEFRSATEKGKKRIISQQLNPDVFRVPWYQMSKARVKKSIELKGDLTPVYNGINTLMQRETKNKVQESKKRSSIDALERFVRIKLPHILNEIDYFVIKPKSKSIIISDVEVIVAPEVIIKGKLNGKCVMGAVKIHISKSKPFDLQKSKIVASTIFKYLEREIDEDGTIVLPELCFSLDIYGDRIVSAQDEYETTFQEVNTICNEIKHLWDAA